MTSPRTQQGDSGLEFGAQGGGPGWGCVVGGGSLSSGVALRTLALLWGEVPILGGFQPRGAWSSAHFGLTAAVGTT